MRILIVDDSEDNVLLARKYLEDEHACYTALCGEDALKILATEPIDLALLDIMMPRMTGLTLFQFVRELRPDLAVIFLTSVDDLNMAVDHMKSGAADYLLKPVTRQRLRQVVQDALTERHRKLSEQKDMEVLAQELEDKRRQLEAKAQEIRSLNTIYQKHLTESFAKEQAAG